MAEKVNILDDGIILRAILKQIDVLEEMQGRAMTAGRSDVVFEISDKIRYDIWIEKGWVRTCPGNKINPDVVWEWFVEIQEEYDIYLNIVGYDSWSAEMWANKMKQTFGEKTMHPVIQGKKTLSNPMKMLAKDFEAHRIIYNNNGLLKWCIANTSVDEDKNGNIQPIKNRRPTQRIDGLAALLDAYTVLQDNLDDYLSVI